MKTRLIALSLALAGNVFAGGIPVYDAVHSTMTQLNQVFNYVEYINQTLESAEQTKTQVEQLKRIGDFSSITELSGLDDFYSDLQKAGKIDSISTIAGRADGSKILTGNGNGLFESIGTTYKAGGKDQTRDSDRYKAQAAVAESVKYYQERRTANDTRRQKLRQAVAESQAQAQTATTEAEVMKAQGTVRALQEQLDVVDREDAAAAREIAVLEAQIDAQERAESKARAEETAKEWEEATDNLSEGYALPQIKPDRLDWKR